MRALAFVISLPFLCSASLEAQIRVMPMGDSITMARKDTATYRYFLWNQLLAAGFCVDFVGSLRGVQTGAPKYPDFDQDHEGHWGWRADQMQAKAYDFAKAAMPDVVLLHIGSNDLFAKQSAASTRDEIGGIIDELRRAVPKVTVFVAKIIPFAPNQNVDVKPLNTLIPALVASKSTTASPVILVDQFDAWDSTRLTYDEVHPNELGERLMADTWFTAFDSRNYPKCRVAKTGPTRVMPLGDSITVARAGYASYRYFLWNDLKRTAHCIDFVGTKSGVQSGKPKYPDFDQDHEGHFDERADEILERAYYYSRISKPEIVLMHLGSVDLFQKQDVKSTVTDLERIIDELRLAQPKVRIFLSKLVPFGAKWGVDVRGLNAEMAKIQARKDTATSPITIVDNFTGYDPKIHSYDGVHPNEAGEKLIAANFHAAVRAVLPTCVATFETIGQGCAGSNGTPKLQASGTSRPVLGQSFSVSLTSLPKSGLVVGFAGASDVDWGGLALPADLGFLGMPNCVLRTGLSVQAALPNNNGTVSWVIPVPSVSSLSGEVFWIQAFAADPKANTWGAIVTNAGFGRLGVR